MSAAVTTRCRITLAEAQAILATDDDPFTAAMENGEVGS